MYLFYSAIKNISIVLNSFQDMETTAQKTFQNDFTHKSDSVHSRNEEFKLRNGTEYKMQYGVEGPKGALVLDGYSAQDVARAMIEKGGQAETFYLLDMDEIYRRIQHLKKMMPRVQIFYGTFFPWYMIHTGLFVIY